MSVTYFVALPFVSTEDGIAVGEAQECPNEFSAIRRAEFMSRKPPNVGALAFKRTGDPSLGTFADATVLKTFGEVPEEAMVPSKVRTAISRRGWRTRCSCVAAETSKTSLATVGSPIRSMT